MTRHIQIKEVDLDTVWQLRREVLFPERSIDGAKLENNARTTAQSLYERFDMKPVGSPWEEKGYTYIKMEKQFS